MTDQRDAAVESALLRASLFLTANVLKDYATAKHTLLEDGWRAVRVPEGVRDRAVDALARANGMLRDQGRSR